MLRVGLTGGLAAGKTLVAQMFSDLGAQVIQADLLARDLMSPGQSVYHEVVRHFGDGILDAEGNIDRPKLAALAFGKGRIHELNEIVHPAVIREQEQWMTDLGAADPQSIAIVEAALIFEAGVARRFDKLVVVTAPETLRIDRFVQRALLSGGVDRQEAALRSDARERLSTQMPEQEKIAAADYVIDNSSSLNATRKQVEHIYGALEKDLRRNY